MMARFVDCGLFICFSARFSPYGVVFLVILFNAIFFFLHRALRLAVRAYNFA